LQPTSPLRDADDICHAFEIFEKKCADSVVSVCETEHSPLLCNTLGEDGSMNGFIDQKKVGRRQDLSVYYRLNGAIYIQKTEDLMSGKGLYGARSYASIMSRDHSVDIDEELDFLIAEAIMSRQIPV
jgi:CMP-N,N'-diacetyllegionaminic acid synthase